ncbi:MAG: glutamyl-tRNA reductase [Actinomycetaceae bacterium]|nr:glutamyl-tRNA reductase [Actinomycetaceae bacterium]
MGLKLFSVNHRDHNLRAVEQLTPRIHDDLERDLRAAHGVRGSVVLSTCNRIEILLDVDEDASADRAIEGLFDGLASPADVTPGEIAPGEIAPGEADSSASEPDGVRLSSDAAPPAASEVGAHAGLGGASQLALVNPREFNDIEAVRHLSYLASGLESMVVGEREITGQLRHAQHRARRRDTLSPAISEALDAAFKTARKVERETGLSGMGRSVAAVALDHAAQFVGDYADANVTLFGTGSYAGATVTQLKERGCRNIAVHSASGRAEAFARGRGLRVVKTEDLAEVLAQTDMIVSARGTGSPTVTTKHVKAGVDAREPGRPLVVLDLAIVRDVEPEVANIPGVTLIDLDTIRSLVPKLEPAKTARARQIVGSEVDAFEKRTAARALDPVIIQMRTHLNNYIDQEMAHLPQRELGREDVERALHRLANKLLHHPTIAAHAEGARGNADEFKAALELVTGMTFNEEQEQD